jgi:hypothetical protein
MMGRGVPIEGRLKGSTRRLRCIHALVRDDPYAWPFAVVA